MSVKKTYPYINIINDVGKKVKQYAHAPNNYHIALTERGISLCDIPSVCR